MRSYLLHTTRRAFLLMVLGAASLNVLGADRPIIVDTGFVEQAAARGALIWDVRSSEEYRRGHIPGAVNVDEVAQVLRDPNTEDYIALAKMEQILGEAGIDPTREIVLYGAKAHTSPYFGYVTVRYLGGANAFVYHGGVDDWKAAGKPVSTDPVKLPPAVFKTQVDRGIIVSTRDVIARLNDAKVQIVDARTAREYNGEDIRALRGGHIPGAVNIPYESNWVDPDTPRKLQRRQVPNKDGMNLKPVNELRALYAALDPDKETIVYCQSGVRASETATVLKTLGFRDVRVYDSSWLGYGNTFDAPAENVTYFNVGKVNSQILQMQQRIDLLEAQIEELKTAKEKK